MLNLGLLTLLEISKNTDLLTRLTAQGPKSRNLPSKSSARGLRTWLSNTYEKEKYKTLIYIINKEHPPPPKKNAWEFTNNTASQ